MATAEQQELSERQVTVLRGVKQALSSEGHKRGEGVQASDVAQQINPSDPPDARGVAQTLRRVRDQLELVESTDSGWKFTRKGSAKARSL